MQRRRSHPVPAGAAKAAAPLVGVASLAKGRVQVVARRRGDRLAQVEVEALRRDELREVPLERGEVVALPPRRGLGGGARRSGGRRGGRGERLDVGDGGEDDEAKREGA